MYEVCTLINVDTVVNVLTENCVVVAVAVVV
jgi:hypothetical protein